MRLFIVGLLAIASVASVAWQVRVDDQTYRVLEGPVQAHIPQPGTTVLTVTDEVARQIVDNVGLSNGVVFAMSPLPTPPQQFSNGIETPVVVLTTDPAGIGIGVIADDVGNLVTYVDHASPRPDAATLAARKAAAKAANDALRQALRDNRAVTTNIIATVQALDLTDTTAAGQKAQLIILRKAVIDLAQEHNKLRSVVRDVLKGED